MKRRTFLAVTTTTTATIAGCLGGETLSAELSDGDSESFEASEGDGYEVTIEATDDDEVRVAIDYDFETTREEMEDQEDAANMVGGLFTDPVLEETVEEEETFDIEIEADGYYVVDVSRGTASVTIE